MARLSFFRASAWSYWSTLLQLISNPRTVQQYLDVPLQNALPRSRWYTAWSTTLLGTSLFIGHQAEILRWVAVRIGSETAALQPFTLVLDLVLLILFAAVGYGFLRLYTLVSHVMTINVFKTRGQRLRLLNVETTLLTLSAPVSAAYVLSLVTPVMGRAVLVILLVYGVAQLSYAFNLIFHKRRLGGLGLVIGSTCVTWFILAIGALAITVMLAVLAFFVLAILRLFVHH